MNPQTEHVAHNASTSNVRDPLRTAAEYRALATEEAQDVEREGALGIPPLTAPLRFVRVANARYSAGETPARVLDALDYAAAYRVHYFAQSNYSLLGYGHLSMDLEVFAGGALVGGVGTLVDTFERCTIEKSPPLGILALMEQFCAMWRNEHRPLTSAELAGLKRLTKEWLLLPPLFAAVVDRNQQAFTTHLSGYLDAWWAKNVLVMSREDRYAGRWCVLAAGLCCRMGFVPALTPATAQYLPVELVVRGTAAS